MSKSRARARRVPVMSFVVAVLFQACDLVDLSGLPVTLFPSASGDVLPAGATPRVVFGDDVDRISAERAFSLSSARGAVPFDFEWRGRSLSVRLRSELEPGVRYTLALRGSVKKANGNSCAMDAEVSFYYATDAAYPRVVSFAPAIGESVGVLASVRLDFDAVMDRASVEEAFSLSPASDCDFAWISDTSVVATPRSRLKAMQYYRWTLADTAMTSARVRTWRETKGSFYTAADFVRPSVVEAVRAVRIGNSFSATSPGLDGLCRGESIVIDFSEPMDMGETLPLVRVDSGFRGSAIAVDADTIAFVPDPSNAYGRTCTLVIPKEACDLSGIAMGEDFRVVFAMEDMSLGIESIVFVANGVPTTVTAHSVQTPVPLVVNDASGNLLVRIVFDMDFTDGEAKLRAATSIKLDTFFPLSAPSPTLFSVAWPDDHTIELHYHDADGGEAGSPNYFKLVIPKGLRTSFSSDFYYDLASEAWLYIEVTK